MSKSILKKFYLSCADGGYNQTSQYNQAWRYIQSGDIIKRGEISMGKNPIFHLFAGDGTYAFMRVAGKFAAVRVDKVPAVQRYIERFLISVRVAGCAVGEFFIHGCLACIVYAAVYRCSHKSRPCASARNSFVRYILSLSLPFVKVF